MSLGAERFKLEWSGLVPWMALLCLALAVGIIREQQKPAYESVWASARVAPPAIQVAALAHLSALEELGVARIQCTSEPRRPEQRMMSYYGTASQQFPMQPFCEQISPKSAEFRVYQLNKQADGRWVISLSEGALANWRPEDGETLSKAIGLVAKEAKNQKEESIHALATQSRELEREALSAREAISKRESFMSEREGQGDGGSAPASADKLYPNASMRFRN